MPSEANDPPLEQVSLMEIFWAFAVIGATSFGGGVVAYLRDAIVLQRRWMTSEEFLAALEIGQTLPGLNSTNIAVIVGRKLRGALGATAAALGMIIPGALVVAVLGVVYIRFRGNPDVTAVLAGVAAAAVGLLLQVTLKIGSRQLLNLRDLAFVIPVFIMVGVFHVSLLVTLLTVAPLAVWLHRPGPKTPPPSAP